MREAPYTLGKGWYFLALCVALLLHLTVAAYLFWAPTTQPQGQAKAAGTGGIEISLGPAGSAAGGPKTQTGEAPAESLAPPEPAGPKPAPEPTLIPEPEPQPKAEPPPERAPLPTPQPEKNLAPEPMPQPEQIEQPAPVKETTPASRASIAGATGRSGSKAQNDSGSGDNSAGGGLPGMTQDYTATLLAWLEHYKEYPRRARLRRQQGTALLYFIIDRTGRVLNYRLHQSSGHRILDNEVLSMIQRAQPLPPIPDKIDREQLELIVPVQFFLR